MSYGLLYYLITVSSSILKASMIFLTVLVSLLIFTAPALTYLEGSDEQRFCRTTKPYIKTGFFISIFLIILNIVIPSKKEMLIITGLTLGSETIDKAATLPPKLLDLINKELDKNIKEK